MIYFLDIWSYVTYIFVREVIRLLDTQIQIYSCDTGNFYSKHEERLHKKNHRLRVERNQLINGNAIKLQKNRKIKKAKKSIIGLKEIVTQLQQYGISNADLKLIIDDEFDYDKFENDDYKTVMTLALRYKQVKELIEHKLVLIKQTKEELLDLLRRKADCNISSNGRYCPRILIDNSVSQKEVISVFESALTRAIGLAPDCLSDEIIVVQVYYFDILKDIISNGFYFQGEKYIFLTASAGQIRTKKVVFIKASTWQRIEKTMMCGLSVDIINEKGGINSNKFLAYTALNNSATDEWKEFDIDKTIVIDDFETNVLGDFDFVDEKDFSITRKRDYVPITHTDGCGMILPDAFDIRQQNKMVRLPWIKGLLGVFDFVSFIKEKECSPVIKDIYGIEHDVIKEDIQVIFTKSQFKLYKYYDNWHQYKDYFKRYNCKAGFTNPEQDRIKNATINYQMLQSLTDITDDEISDIAYNSISTLTEMCTSVNKVKQVLGVTPYTRTEDMTPLQQAIQIYPELLNDSYIRSKLKDIKDSLIKKYKAGKLQINGKYTFLLPDLYAACEHWFQGIEVPNGLLNDGEVFCWLFRQQKELDCLRSPHLFMEHAVRNNVATNDNEQQLELRKWFCTNAIYTSSFDLISKVLMFDNDGDCGLIVANQTIIEVAKRNVLKYDIVPLYYNMAKAPAVQISKDKIYNNLTVAFTGGNIGQFSNNISKIWNSEIFISGSHDDKQHAINCIKRLCCMNNFVIDMAKTLYMPEYPREVKEDIKEFTKLKLPHFFVYAKDKTEDQVETTNKSFVNKLSNVIPNPRISHKYINQKGKTRRLEKPDYTLLMYDEFCYVDESTNPVIQKYSEIVRDYSYKLKELVEGGSPRSSWTNARLREYLRYKEMIKIVKSKMSETGYSDIEIADILTEYLYRTDNKNKGILWNCYGDILLSNLKQWMKKPTKEIQCTLCGKWIEVDIRSKSCRCDKCKTK